MPTGSRLRKCWQDRFEAYIAQKLQTGGYQNQSITKLNEIYHNKALSDMAKVYPAPDDRAVVFAAWDQVVEAIAAADILGGSRVMPYQDAKIARAKKASNAPEGKKRSIFFDTESKIAKARKQDEKERTKKARNERRQIRFGGNATPTQLQIAALDDGFGAATRGWVQTVRGQILQMRRKYPLSMGIEEIYKLFATNPGAREAGRPRYEQVLRQNQRRFVSKMGNIEKKHDIFSWSAAEQRVLRDILVATEENYDRLAQDNAKIVAAAADIRFLLDDLWDFLVQNGVELGYPKNGYLPRQMDENLIKYLPNQGAEFRQRAGKVYEIVFDRDIASIEDIETRDEDAIQKFVDAINYFNKKGGYTPEAKELIKDLQTALRDLADGTEKGVSDDSIAAIKDQVNDLMLQLHPETKTLWAEDSAWDWYDGITGFKGAKFSNLNNAAKTDFERVRYLPPEADEIMGDYMLVDPMELVNTYIMKASRRGTMSLMLGAENHPDAKGRPSGWKLDDIFEQMHNEGIENTDYEELERAVSLMIGSYKSNMGRAGMNFQSKLQTIFMPWMLARSLFSQIAEPQLIATRLSGEDMKGLITPWNALFEDMKTWLPEHLGSQTARENSAWRREMSEFLGLTTDALHSEILSNRYNMMFQTENDAIRSARAFRWLGIHAHGMALRRAAMEMAFKYVSVMASRAKNNDANAIAALAEIGIINPNEIDALAALGATPSVEELQESPYLRQVMGTIGQLVDEATPDPKVVDKPRWASQPELAHLYGIMSFAAAVQRIFIGLGKTHT